MPTYYLSVIIKKDQTVMQNSFSQKLENIIMVEGKDPTSVSPGRMSLLSRIALVLVVLVPGPLDWPPPESWSPGDAELPGSTTLFPPCVPHPPYAILDGEEGMERTMGGDMDPCRPCSVLRPDDLLWTGLWLPYNTSLEICRNQKYNG